MLSWRSTKAPPAAHGFVWVLYLWRGCHLVLIPAATDPWQPRFYACGPGRRSNKVVAWRPFGRRRQARHDAAIAAHYAKMRDHYGQSRYE